MQTRDLKVYRLYFLDPTFCTYFHPESRPYFALKSRILSLKWEKFNPGSQKTYWGLSKTVISSSQPPTQTFFVSLCTYQCKSREGGVRARGGDLMPETIPLSGFWSCEVTPGSGHLTLTDRSLVSIQKRLPSPSLKAFWKSPCWRRVWS